MWAINRLEKLGFQLWAVLLQIDFEAWVGRIVCAQLHEFITVSEHHCTTAIDLWINCGNWFCASVTLIVFIDLI